METPLRFPLRRPSFYHREYSSAEVVSQLVPTAWRRNARDT
jgi:hypothetical protein